ncbi:hypothetical protein FE257_010780 [Aspergillus nanangensis]|uniref:Uncharacterized protein n=1 Tax=Aspergillus nanangensis TaxID=2582783 RepID=A0AAD4CVX3_ASPNN|nr:hypothetical protein FE257_010780 [Aspergillus nanangensis]
MWNPYFVALAALAVHVKLARSDDLMYSNSSSCVDPTGFDACRHRVWESRGDCMGNCKDGKDDCINACDCLEAQKLINCGATSCWNEVYLCPYQDAVGQLLYTCPDVDVDQIPFWPIPDNAPGRCVCDVAEVANKQREIRHSIDTCDAKINSTDEASKPQLIRACECCTMSALISSIWDTCPNTDPSTNTFPYWNRTLFSPYDWDTCGPTLQENNCTDILELGDDPAERVENFYEPDNVPKNGTGVLTNTGGPISTPASGSTFTWTIGASTYPITAAASNTAVPSGTDGSHASGQGAQETGGGESVAPLRSRPSILVAVTVVGFYIGLVVC